MAAGDSLAFGSLLRRYREAASLTQEALAERARLSARAISDLERGVKHTPRHDTVALQRTISLAGTYYRDDLFAAEQDRSDGKKSH